MPDRLKKENTIEGEITMASGSGLSLGEINIGCIWSIKSCGQIDVEAFSLALFSRKINPGGRVDNGNSRLIQYAPNAAYYFSDSDHLPDAANGFKSILADVSHGFCDLKLSGIGVFDFLNAHTPVDLKTACITRNQWVKTRLELFNILLWWNDIKNIHILVDRSYARSCADYLSSLSDRWITKQPQANTQL